MLSLPPHRRKFRKGRRASPGGEAQGWELQGGIVGGNAGGRIFLDGAVELGNPYGADFPCPDLRLGSALLDAAGAVLLNLP